MNTVLKITTQENISYTYINDAMDAIITDKSRLKYDMKWKINKFRTK